MSRDGATLFDIVGALGRVVEYAAGIGPADLDTDHRTRAAILYEIMIVGEATKRLSPAFRAAHPMIPWSKMAGMRDRLIHGYDDVDLEIVWEVASHFAPELLRILGPILEAEAGVSDDESGAGREGGGP